MQDKSTNKLYVVIECSVKEEKNVTPRQADANTAGNTSDSIVPQKLVKLNINTDVVSSHGLLSELSDDLECLGGPCLEGAKEIKLKNLI